MPTKSGKTRYYWTIYVLLITFTYAMIILHISYIHRQNLVNMMKSIGLAIAFFGSCFKAGVFLINRKSLIKYHQTLNNLFEEELMRNEEIRTIMLSSLSTIRILAYTYSVVLISTLTAYCMPAYISIIRDLCHLHLTTNYILPITKGFGYFWTVPNNFFYHIHLLFETCVGLLSSLVACSIDSIFGFYVYQFASMMSAMTFRLLNPLPTDKFSDLLRICVTKHQKLLQCRNTLEYIYGIIIFWHIITNAVFFCALIYEVMSFSSLNTYNVLAFLTYGLVKLLQTFKYAFYGTVLTNAGEDFCKGLYFSGWSNSDLSRHMRTNVILMMMQKPMSINAIFCPIHMVIFTNFVNTTMSYFFLLRSIGE